MWHQLKPCKTHVYVPDSLCSTLCLHVCLCGHVWGRYCAVCVWVLAMCLRVCIHACMRVCVCVCVRACERACMCACVHACVRASVHVYMHVCVHACVSVCMHIHISICASEILWCSEHYRKPQWLAQLSTTRTLTFITSTWMSSGNWGVMCNVFSTCTGNQCSSSPLSRLEWNLSSFRICCNNTGKLTCVPNISQIGSSCLPHSLGWNRTSHLSGFAEKTHGNWQVCLTPLELDPPVFPTLYTWEEPLTIWNRMRPWPLTQNQHTRELISTWKMSHKHNNKDLSCLQ